MVRHPRSHHLRSSDLWTWSGPGGGTQPAGVCVCVCTRARVCVCVQHTCTAYIYIYIYIGAVLPAKPAPRHDRPFAAVVTTAAAAAAAAGEEATADCIITLGVRKYVGWEAGCKATANRQARLTRVRASTRARATCLRAHTPHTLVRVCAHISARAHTHASFCTLSTRFCW
jgi:hypothetical protein